VKRKRVGEMTLKRDYVGVVVITRGTNLYDQEENSHANTPIKSYFK
jgi:hypothetical protein